MVNRIAYNYDTGTKLENSYYCIKKIQLGFTLKIEMPQLCSARLGTFLAQLGSAWEISAQTHHYANSFKRKSIQKNQLN